MSSRRRRTRRRVGEKRFSFRHGLKPLGLYTDTHTHTPYVYTHTYIYIVVFAAVVNLALAVTLINIYYTQSRRLAADYHFAFRRKCLRGAAINNLTGTARWSRRRRLERANLFTKSLSSRRLRAESAPRTRRDASTDATILNDTYGAARRSGPRDARCRSRTCSVWAVRLAG